MWLGAMPESVKLVILRQNGELWVGAPGSVWTENDEIMAQRNQPHCIQVIIDGGKSRHGGGRPSRSSGLGHHQCGCGFVDGLRKQLEHPVLQLGDVGGQLVEIDNALAAPLQGVLVAEAAGGKFVYRRMAAELLVIAARQKTLNVPDMMALAGAGDPTLPFAHRRPADLEKRPKLLIADAQVAAMTGEQLARPGGEQPVECRRSGQDTAIVFLHFEPPGWRVA